LKKKLKAIQVKFQTKPLLFREIEASFLQINAEILLSLFNTMANDKVGCRLKSSKNFSQDISKTAIVNILGLY